MSEPSLAVAGQGVKRTVLNGVPYDYRAGQYLVVSLDLPVIGQALEASPEEPFAVFSMRLKPAAIAALLLETAGTAKPPAFTGLAVSDAKPELLDPVVRLQEARALLMNRPVNVAEIGYRVGYDSPSQFSREYRRTFGTTPRRDAAHLAATAGAPA